MGSLSTKSCSLIGEFREFSLPPPSFHVSYYFIPIRCRTIPVLLSCNNSICTAIIYRNALQCNAFTRWNSSPNITKSHDLCNSNRTYGIIPHPLQSKPILGCPVQLRLADCQISSKITYLLALAPVRLLLTHFLIPRLRTRTLFTMHLPLLFFHHIFLLL